MASSSPANAINSNQVEVELRDWWLINPDDDDDDDDESEENKKKLAVAGFTYREKQVFKSAAIIKRSTVFTLETADGTTVILQGFFNKNRTIENGFPSEVFSHFMFGFPSYWEDYAEKYVKETATNNSENQNAGNEDGLTCGNTNTLMETRCPEAGDCQDSKQPSNFLENTMKSDGEEVHDITPSKVKPKSFGNGTSSKVVEDLKVNPKSTEKTRIVSPDSFRRSKSGRLLLPTLEFWRNQMPIYDMHRTVIAVQEEVSSSVGSKSEPKKQKKRQ